MKSIYRSIALLAFMMVSSYLAHAQSRIVGVQLQSTTLQVQETAPCPAEIAQMIPVLEAWQNPGARSIHVSLHSLPRGTTFNISLIAPNNRLVRNQNVHLCTMCGTFDIDLEDEVKTGRHTVIVEIGGSVMTRTIWVE